MRPVDIDKLVGIEKWYIDDVGGCATVTIGSTQLGSTGDHKCSPVGSRSRSEGDASV